MTPAGSSGTALPRACLAAGLAACLAAALAGCGAQQATGGSGTAPVADTAAAHRVRVGLTEWQVDLAPTRALPGRITLVVTNAGATEHDLVVQRGGHRWSLPALSPGRRATLVLRAPAGSTLRLSSRQPGQLRPMSATLPVGR
ncbi:MAG TPA: hypothetical protein VFL69_14375 [Marmoricola sp.]|nr:hypothetical protein [Marmoricola sp.]